MTWIAGYQDRRGCHDDSGEGTYADARAWLLEQLDQRALMIESANDYDPVRDGDQVEELLTVRRYFQGLSENFSSRGHVERDSSRGGRRARGSMADGGRSWS